MMSEQIRTFNEVVEDYSSKLDLLTSAITRAHGKHHPEAFEVRELYEAMNAKIKEAGTDKPNLDEEFTRLRKSQITTPSLEMYVKPMQAPITCYRKLTNLIMLKRK